MFIIISDECGDTGISYRKGTKTFASGSLITFNKNDLTAINDIARFFSRKWLDSPLRKWSDLKGCTKNNPVRQLYRYVRNLLQECSLFHFSFFLKNAFNISEIRRLDA